jgi:hypothetical protein
MLNIRATSVVTALTFVLSSFVPVHAAPIAPRAPAQVDQPATTGVVDVQYYRERDRNWRRGPPPGYRAGPPRRDGYYNGHRGYRDRRPGYRQHNGYWFPLAAFATGAIIGGAINNNQARPAYGGSHHEWCANRWRSYRAYDNSYQPNNGPRRECVSPFMR